MRMGLGIGLGIAHSGARPYAFTNAEAAALVARFTTPPTDARKKLIDTLVGSLKTAGVWSKLDALYIMAAADSQAARRNWIQDAYNLTAVNTPTFTADRGYAGDGASAYLKTGFTPSTALGHVTQNSASIGGWVNLEPSAANQTLIGGGTGTLLRIDPRRTDNNCAAILNDGSFLASIVATAVGYSVGIRTGASARSLRRGSSQLAANTTASTGLTANEITILALNGTGNFCTLRAAAGFFGEALADAESDALYNALSTYLTAIGAN